MCGDLRAPHISSRTDCGEPPNGWRTVPAGALLAKPTDESRGLRSSGRSRPACGAREVIRRHPTRARVSRALARARDRSAPGVTGDARTRGDQEWRYYACPVANRRVTTNEAGEPAKCDNKRIPAPLVEDALLREIAAARMPEDAIDAAREMLKERLSKPADDLNESKRRRLERALESLRKQHQWGDLADDEYRRERREIEAAVASLPAQTTDTLVAFDEARARLLSMPEAIAAASDERRAEIVALLVERVAATRTMGLTGLEWTAPAAPFFRRVVLSERAVWADGPRSQHPVGDADPLTWYVA